MKKTSYFFILSLICVSSGVYAQSTMQTYLDYIATWRDIAVQQEKDYGIPASITMAQALLESGAGKSELAREANNHFGIKCSGGWMGDVYYHDDDAQGECFRVYQDAAESFKDHSVFLQKPRYKPLYEIPVADYQTWAVRIRECGYATDPKYPAKLIKLIEDYGLDSLSSGSWQVPTQEQVQAAAQVRKQSKPKETNSSAEEKGEGDEIKLIVTDPEPDREEPLSAREERKRFYEGHTRKYARMVPYIIAREGDTYSNIAFRLNIPERDVREWNDALGLTLKEGERVYLGKKHKYGERKKAVLWVHPGESLRMIAQREVMQLKSLYRLNEISERVVVFRTRQQILTRKVKEKQ